MNEIKQPGFIIPRRMIYTESEVRTILESKLREANQALDSVDELYKPLRKAAENLDAALGNLFTGLLFVASPDWKLQMGKLETKFNAQVKEAQRAVQDAEESVPRELKPFIARYTNGINQMASDVNGALNNALMSNGDGGAALNQLRQTLPGTKEVFESEIMPLLTDQIARDRRLSRAKVHIGTRMNELEAQGITKIAEMWQTVYADLQRDQSTLTGDALAAWEYFEGVQPHSLSGYLLRNFEKEMSRYKNDMRPTWALGKVATK